MKCCPECGYTKWPEDVQQAIENQAREIRSWLEDAVGDLGGHDMETIKMCVDTEVLVKVEQAIKDGVTDVPGWLADYYFNDIDTLHDFTGDRIHDASYDVIRSMTQMSVEEQVKSGNPPETTRLRVCIAISKHMQGNAHSALRIALDDHIGEWINRLKTKMRLQREAEADAYGDSQIPPWEKRKMRVDVSGLKVCSQCASPTNRPVEVHGQVLCQACSSKL
jgi:hypothetical protein